MAGCRWAAAIAILNQMLARMCGFGDWNSQAQSAIARVNRSDLRVGANLQCLIPLIPGPRGRNSSTTPFTIRGWEFPCGWKLQTHRPTGMSSSITDSNRAIAAMVTDFIYKMTPERWQ